MRVNRKPYKWLLALVTLVLLVLNGCNQNSVDGSVTLESQTLFSKSITVGADDIDVSTASTYFNATDTKLYLASTSNGQNTGLRFQGMTIPKNAFVCSASIKFKSAQAGTAIGTAGFTVKGVDQDNAPAFTSNTDYNGRIPTTQSTNYVPTAWALDQFYSVDVKTIVQALVNRTLWASGNAVAFKITSNNINGDLKAYSFENTSANKVVAQLNVDYSTTSCGGSTQTVNYTEDTTNIINPERGFQYVKVGSPVTQPLDSSDASAMNTKAQTVVHRIYNIKDYKGTASTYVPIAQTYLNAITAEMNWARTNGFKMDIRFAYNFNDANTNDAPLSTIQNHIDQLTPILQANSDVIAFMSAGFAGQFGEWHDSTNGLIGVGSDVLALNANGITILDKLLAVTNFGRPIVLRSPRNKREYIYYKEVNSTINPSVARVDFSRSLQASQAYASTLPNSRRARLGHMNDCFTASTTQVNPSGLPAGTYVYGDNGGTYFPSLVSNTAGQPNNTTELNQQKDYLNQENQFLPQVGEGCAESSSGSYTTTFSDCTPARAELIRMRWSHLTEMNNTFTTNWTNQGCLDEFKKRLGYRFILNSATFPTTQSGAANQILSVTLNIKNDGFARPYNPRGLELVLQKQGTTTYTRLPVSTAQDVRLLLPAPSTTNTALSLSATLTSALSAGTYDLFLNLPDPKTSLNINSKYSIRLANTNTWNSTKGYNKLGSLTIQ